jgi:Protein of unknown function (DUF2934)
MPKSKFPKKTNGAEQAVSSAVTPVAGANGQTDFALERNPTEGAIAASTTAQSTEAEMKTATTKKVRKPEIVKTESRMNLVPINLEDEIRSLAYLLSERRGFQPGHETEDWLTAEHEVLERYHQQTA